MRRPGRRLDVRSVEPVPGPTPVAIVWSPMHRQPRRRRRSVMRGAACRRSVPSQPPRSEESREPSRASRFSSTGRSSRRRRPTSGVRGLQTADSPRNTTRSTAGSCARGAGKASRRRSGGLAGRSVPRRRSRIGRAAAVARRDHLLCVQSVATATNLSLISILVGFMVGKAVRTRDREPRRDRSISSWRSLADLFEYRGE